ncbi:Hsp20/alpha crystallin family protein [Algoriphagus sediminis]|uniref:Hsp20/alpha crystallin family protein n=1 Tax=Algoriphagus sediminis TaxID=3057113 RepID=A0ABT7YGA9_9BACT|nr:Hsp20/alpha crystallin family protein [Algoriphagus sediminis]MDN3205567.1 Hsp20/alpha crystallin family protein [Algoriphagus sediminis]
MKLVRYNQLNSPKTDTFYNMIDQFFNDSFPNGEGQFNPAVDIAEDEKSYEIELSIPGAKKEDFKVDLTDGSLTISGERRREEKTEGKNFHRIQSQYGKFQKTFQLPDDATSENISASYQDGILKILIPKEEKKIQKSVIEVK